MKITKKDSPPPQSEPIAGSFYSMGQLIQDFAQRHNFDELLEEMSSDKAVDHILKKKKEKTM